MKNEKPAINNNFTNQIIVRGAREHNLRGINVNLPKGKLIVFSGVSGSGKSSLAFDTLHAEGQRRFVESLSCYARQFLGQLPKPDVDYLGGLCPSISIEQKMAGHNPRSTVGTITEIYDFLRVLFAKIGVSYCPNCSIKIEAQKREQILARILANNKGFSLLILAPVIREQKGEFKELIESFLKKGFLRARVDNEIIHLDQELHLDRNKKHSIDVVIDRIKINSENRGRIAESIDSALEIGNGEMIISIISPEHKGKTFGNDIFFSSKYSCRICELSFSEPTPQLFSFNSPTGMCTVCDGMGALHTFDPDLLIPDSNISFYNGAIPIIGKMAGMGRWRRHIYEGVAVSLGINLKQAWGKQSEEHSALLLYGAGGKKINFEWKKKGGEYWSHSGKWEGIVPQLMASVRKSPSGPRRIQLEKYMRVMGCSGCCGERLSPLARAVKVGGLTLPKVASKSIEQLSHWLSGENNAVEFHLDETQKIISQEIFREIRSRIQFMMDVGLNYLTLDRMSPTLSGGEAQRIRLASQIGCGLKGILYVLDEPSIGLHPSDNARLIKSIKNLRDLGNTVVVVEHDEDTIRAADWIVDFGPGPGIAGGEVVAEGKLLEIKENPRSVTGNYLSGRNSIHVPSIRRTGTGENIIIFGAKLNNLKNITVRFPIGKFICVTGVSGSGKSSLVNGILKPFLTINVNASKADSKLVNYSIDDVVDKYDSIEGIRLIDKVVSIDQAPIGRTPRSNPGTYIKVFDEIRLIFSLTNESKARGYGPGRFSFNRPGGRCESCEGNGSTKLEMEFLADVWMICAVCNGQRFDYETLQIRYRGKNIHDAMEMDVSTAQKHFEAIPKICKMLETLKAVGLDYLKLGQPSTTLSGGEAQRIKLARELCKRSTGKTLFLLDEPTTGLHFSDVKKLLEVLHSFVDFGNTVLVIEHNLDVVKTADWIIDIGPGGGERGGQLIVAGTPEEVVASPCSQTGNSLISYLDLRRYDPNNANEIIVAGEKPVSPEDGKSIVIKGACQHNLRNISLEIPTNKVTVFSGPSGSGKTSMAIDTLFAEGQRRYIESLSSYARQFLGQIEKPKVESITGLSPSICIEQKTASRSPRSTVGTVTEIHDYLRVLFARLGTLYCHACKVQVGSQSIDEIIDKIMILPEGTRVYLLSPVYRRNQESFEGLFEGLRRDGYARVRIDGVSLDLDSVPLLDHRRKHEIEVVVDRLVIRAGQRTRIADSVEKAILLGKGNMRIAVVQTEKKESAWTIEAFSQTLSCPQCGKGFEKLKPYNFSFNNSLGWCSSCEGLGFQKGTQVKVVVRDVKRSLRQSVLIGWPIFSQDEPFQAIALALGSMLDFDLDQPWEIIPEYAKKVILHGFPTYQEVPLAGDRDGYCVEYRGVFPAMQEGALSSLLVKEKMDSLVGEIICSGCNGSRLCAEPSSSRLVSISNPAGFSLYELQSMPLKEALGAIELLRIDDKKFGKVSDLTHEIISRLLFLIDVGLDYLTLSRSAPSLSGGESQRIRLASQIGTGLTGVLYVLDEPTIGLHPRDNARLLNALSRLRDLGNTVVLVEHEREILTWADHLVDFGPGAGDLGGKVVASGKPDLVANVLASPTGQYLSGKKIVPFSKKRRVILDGLKENEATNRIVIVGARQNNLKNISVIIPLGCFVAVTGVSGAGKSSLVNEVLRDTLLKMLHGTLANPPAVDSIDGVANLDKVIEVGQQPLGSSPLSNPATYSGLFDLIRELFAQMTESRLRGWLPGRFSFNRPGGRCEICEGQGVKKIEMYFLPDLWIVCDTCQGKRYNPETLEIRFRNKSISDILEMRIIDALSFFHQIQKIHRILSVLVNVGLGYLKLGQSAHTLSGGEAQRVKLATELAKVSTGRTLYILDEPTTGLHFEDISRLLGVLHGLVDMGNTVVVVEHNIDIIKNADWVIELGPEAGPNGGNIVAQGRPEAIASDIWESLDGTVMPPLYEGMSHTSKYLSRAFDVNQMGHCV